MAMAVKVGVEITHYVTKEISGSGDVTKKN
jgi:hypothetical protein